RSLYHPRYILLLHAAKELRFSIILPQGHGESRAHNVYNGPRLLTEDSKPMDGRLCKPGRPFYLP
ncbi:MAG: hypothetical protein KJ052_19545, partial [Candidatus Hydrogenedentes bacterium]|nr:hypothetical protein [Candidatus Hydrogenedentota bacterium]